jgi:hypothetical protein
MSSLTRDMQCFPFVRFQSSKSYCHVEIKCKKTARLGIQSTTPFPSRGSGTTSQDFTKPKIMDG